jgi:hypothetical protein
MHVRVRSGRVLSFGLVSLTVLGCAAWALLPRASAAPLAAAGSPAALDEELEEAMRDMNGALKSLGKGVDASTRDAALEALSRFEHAAITAKALTPGRAAKIDEKQRAEFVVGYRKTLVEALKLTLDAEVAILDGKYKDADEILKNKLMAIKKSGHDKYQEEEEEGEHKGPKRR